MEKYTTTAIPSARQGEKCLPGAKSRPGGAGAGEERVASFESTCAMHEEREGECGDVSVGEVRE